MIFGGDQIEHVIHPVHVQFETIESTWSSEIYVLHVSFSVLTHAEHGHSCARLGHDEHRAFEGAGQLDVQPVPVYIQRQEQYI